MEIIIGILILILGFAALYYNSRSKLSIPIKFLTYFIIILSLILIIFSIFKLIVIVPWIFALSFAFLLIIILANQIPAWTAKNSLLDKIITVLSVLVEFSFVLIIIILFTLLLISYLFRIIPSVFPGIIVLCALFFILIFFRKRILLNQNRLWVVMFPLLILAYLYLFFPYITPESNLNEFQTTNLKLGTVYEWNYIHEGEEVDINNPIIVSWNIERGKNVEKQIDYLLKELPKKPDIICLQETDWREKENITRIIAEKLNMHAVYAIEFLEVESSKKLRSRIPNH